MTSKPSGGLSLATAVGVSWLVLQTVGTRAVGLVAQLVIASILNPDDFGLIGLAYTISNVGAALVAFGFDQIVVQRQRTLQFWILPTFYLSLGLGIGGCVILVAVAPICATLYGVEQVQSLIDIIALGMPLSALATVPTILLRVRLEFRKIAAINFGETVATQILTIALAFGGLGAYSFAIPSPVVAALKSAALWVAAPGDLSGTWRKVLRGRYLISSSLAVFLAGLVQTLVANGDYIILGLLGTTTAVGNYFFAFKLASQPLLMFAGNLSSALFPALSHMRTNPRAQNEAAFKAAKFMSLIIMPLAFLQAAVIEPAIHVLFRDKWDAAIPLMQILSVALGFDAVAWVAGTLQVAKRGFWKQLVYLSLFSPAFFLCVAAGGIHGSAMGVALGVAAYYIFVTPVYSYIIFRSNGMAAGRLARIYLTPAGLSLIAIAGATAMFRLTTVDNNILQVAITGSMGVSLYVALLWVVDRASFLELQELVRRIVLPRTKRLRLPSLP